MARCLYLVVGKVVVEQQHQEKNYLKQRRQRMFGKKSKFTEADLYKMIQDAMTEKPVREAGTKPNFLELLKSKKGLNKAGNERT